MAKGYEKQNESIIRKALERLSRDKNKIVEDGMKELMDNAMMYVLGEHDAKHWFHKATGNSYGWALMHNGEGVAYKVNEGLHGEGNAFEDLMAASREVPTNGWTGILLASLRVGEDKPNPRMYYFNVDYEIGLLAQTVDFTEESFSSVFKQIAR